MHTKKIQSALPFGYYTHDERSSTYATYRLLLRLRDPKGFGAIRRVSPKENGEVHVHFRERALAEDVSLFSSSQSL